MQNFKKYCIIPAAPEQIYLALTNPLTIQLWTGEPAEMTTEPETEFSMWNGSICGKNLAFEENRKIVQQWYFEGQEEPSIVTIILHPHKKGTSVELKHTNIPDEVYGEFAEGWSQMYFGALKSFYND